MKPNKFLSQVLILGLLTVSISSCEKDLVSTPVVVDEESNVATISGEVKAELDLRMSGLESVKNGTKLTFSIPNSSLLNNSQGNWSKTIEVKDGKYSIKVPCSRKGVEVSIMADAFEAKQELPEGGKNKTRTVNYLLENNHAVSLNVEKGVKYIQNINYKTVGQKDRAMSVVKGLLIGEFSEKTGFEVLPRNKKITFYSNYTNWVYEYISDGSGTYNITVPSNIDIYYRYSFVYPYKQNEITKDLQYTYKSELGNFDANSVYINKNILIKKGLSSEEDIAPTGTIRGKVIGEFDDTKDGYEPADSVEITFTIDETYCSWRKTITTDSNGNYEITDIPSNMPVHLSWSFLKDKIINGSICPYIYRYRRLINYAIYKDDISTNDINLEMGDTRKLSISVN